MLTNIGKQQELPTSRALSLLIILTNHLAAEVPHEIEETGSSTLEKVGTVRAFAVPLVNDPSRVLKYVLEGSRHALHSEVNPKEDC